MARVLVPRGIRGSRHIYATPSGSAWVPAREVGYIAVEVGYRFRRTRLSRVGGLLWDNERSCEGFDVVIYVTSASPTT